MKPARLIVLLIALAAVEPTQRQAELLADSRQQGTLSLALRGIVDINRNNSDLDDGGNGRGLNIVRFGVVTPTAAK